jgi:histidinol phosphatase-like PHP family hydrolase
MDQRYFSILGHPSGRLIGEREPYPVNMPAVIQKAAERGCFLELNANPQPRSDRYLLPDGKGGRRPDRHQLRRAQRERF